MISNTNAKFVSNQYHTVTLNRIRELIDEINCFDSKPDTNHHNQFQRTVFDQAFYTDLQEALSSYLSVYLPDQDDDEYLGVFWDSCAFVGILNTADGLHQFSFSVIQSLVARIAEQVIDRELRVTSC